MKFFVQQLCVHSNKDEAREIVEKALGDSVHHHHAEDDNIDLTRQFSPAEIEELQKTHRSC